MANFLSPLFNEQTFTSTGAPASGYKINTYSAGTTTPAATYTTKTGSTQQSNPIGLNSRGAPDSPIWLGTGQSYKFVLTDANDVVIATYDNVSGINDSSVAGSEWTASGYTPTYISATSFSVQGDKTNDMLVGRRLRTTNTAGSVYSLITASSYNSGTSITTVTVSNDSGALDSGLSAVDLAILTPMNPSVPSSQATRQALGLGYSSSIASAATLPLAARTGNIIDVTGTVATTATDLENGGWAVCIAQAAWPLTYHATNMPLPGGADYTCSAGDRVEFIRDLAGVLTVRIFKQNGSPVIPNGLIFSNGNIVDIRASVPTSGTYTAGDIILESSTRGELAGWKRLTTGSAHVLGTDWAYFCDASRLSTSVATTSGTAIYFTGIPSWVKRITVMLNGVSTNGTTPLYIQVGSGSIATTGYQSAGTSNTGVSVASTRNGSGGFYLSGNRSTTDASYGAYTLTYYGANIWAFSGVTGMGTSANVVSMAGGIVTLGGTLDRVRFTTENGTDAFDAGSVNILME